MSIVSSLFEKKITLGQAWSQFETWASNLVKSDPAFTQATGELLAIAKNGAVQAITLADTALGPLIQPAATSLETALEKYLSDITGGISTPLNPAISGSIDQGAQVLKNLIDTWALEAKSTLSDAPAASGAAPLKEAA